MLQKSVSAKCCNQQLTSWIANEMYIIIYFIYKEAGVLYTGSYTFHQRWTEVHL